MGKIHGKPNIMSISHKFSNLALANSTLALSIAILTKRVLFSFPTRFKDCNKLIHLVFTFHRTFSPLVSIISASLVNSRWCFGEVKKTRRVLEGGSPIWKP